MTDSQAIGKPGAGPQQWELVIGTGANGTKPEIFCQLTTTSRPFEITPVIRCSDEAGKSFKKNSTDTYKFDLPTPLAGDVFMVSNFECLHNTLYVHKVTFILIDNDLIG